MPGPLHECCKVMLVIYFSNTFADGQFLIHSCDGGQKCPAFFAQEPSVCKEVWSAHWQSVLLQRSV